MPKTLKEACELSIAKWEKINRNLELVKNDMDIDIEDQLYEVTKACGLCHFDINNQARCTDCILFDKELRCYERQPYKSIYERITKLNEDGCLCSNSFLDDEEQTRQLEEDVIHYGETLIEKLTEIVEQEGVGKENE